jgi:hypothetical protein
MKFARFDTITGIEVRQLLECYGRILHGPQAATCGKAAPDVSARDLAAWACYAGGTQSPGTGRRFRCAITRRRSRRTVRDLAIGPTPPGKRIGADRYRLSGKGGMAIRAAADEAAQRKASLWRGSLRWLGMPVRPRGRAARARAGQLCVNSQQRNMQDGERMRMAALRHSSRDAEGSGKHLH